MEEIHNPSGAIYDEDIDIESDDDELLSQKINRRMHDAKDLHSKMCEDARKNVLLFRSRIDELSDRPELSRYNSKTSIPKVFTAIRNLVGLTTDNRINVPVIPAKDEAKSIERAKKIEKCLEYGHLRCDFDMIITECLIDTWIKRESYIRWFWDYDNDNFSAEGVKMENLRISSEGKNIQDAEFVIFHEYKNKQWFKKHYPDSYKDIIFKDQADDAYNVESDGEDEIRNGKTALYIELWQNDIIVFKASQVDGKEDLILKKGKNPYYEFRTAQEQLMEEQPEMAMLAQDSGEDVGALLEEGDSDAYEELGFKPITNFFQEPKKPFVQVPSVKLLGQLYSENMLGDHVKEVVLSMNDKKRSYNDNIKGCNTKLVIDKNFFNKDQAKKVTNEPMQELYVDMQANPNPVQIVSGESIPSDFQNDIAHDEAIIDDVFGHHEISRGTGKSPTLGQDELNTESDRTPVRMQTRALERAILEVYGGWIQLIKMFYTSAKTTRSMGKKEGFAFDDMINDDVEDGVEPYIIPGSMLPITENAKVARAMQLWGAGALDPYTLFAQLGMANPDELADRLINWLQFGMVSSEDPAKISADMNNDPEAPGGMMEDSIERADQENEAMQKEEEVPPTPPELLSPEHVKLHFDFIKDPKIKLSDEAYELAEIHAEVDKAGLARIKAIDMAEEAGGQTVDNSVQDKSKQARQTTAQ